MLGYFLQIRQYQKTIRKWLRKGIIGVGQRRGFFRPGEILILVYSFNINKSITVLSMKGFSIFARFRERPELAGLSLEELRKQGIKADKYELFPWRIIFRYNPVSKTRLKGVLIQAVEAVEQHLRETPYVRMYY